MKDGLSRRETIKLTGAMVGTSFISSLSGCTSISSIGNNSPYAEWLPSDNSLGDDRKKSFEMIDFNPYRDNNIDMNQYISPYFDRFEGIPTNFENVNSKTEITDEISIYHHDLNEDSIKNNIISEGYEEDSSHKDFLLYTKTGGGRHYGVGIKDNVTIHTSVAGTLNNPLPSIKKVIDAKSGENRLKDESGDFGTLCGELGSGARVLGSNQSIEETNTERWMFRGVVAQGDEINFNQDMITQKSILVFDNENSINNDKIDEAISNNELEENINSINNNGRVVTIVGEYTIDEIYPS